MSEKKETKVTQQRLSFSMLQFVLLVIGLIGIASFGTYSALAVQANYQQNVITEKTELPDRLVSGLSTAYSLLKSTYLGDLDEEKLIDGALKGFLSGTGDEYTDYLNAQEWSSLQQTTDSSFVGIGVEIEDAGQYIRVVSPYDNTPAQRGGLQTGDLITAVDGKDIADKTVTEVAQLVRGEKGTNVTLTIKRGNSEFNVTFTRDVIPLISVTSHIDASNPTIGIIRISSFAKTTAEEFEKAVTDLRSNGATRFVIDVRNNPGGLLQSVRTILNMFYTNDKIVMFGMEDKEDGVRTVLSTTEAGEFKMTEPVTVLVNKGSASASEVFASSLLENKRATVVGETTFGKGTAQTLVELTDNTGIKITYSKWLTPNGNWIHGNGLTPNEVVELPEYSKYSRVDTATPIEKGASGDTVLNLQKILRALNYNVELTSEFDDKTVSNVSDFQRANDLSVTGSINSETADKINQLMRQKVSENDTQMQKAIELLQ